MCKTQLNFTKFFLTSRTFLAFCYKFGICDLLMLLILRYSRCKRYKQELPSVRRYNRCLRYMSTWFTIPTQRIRVAASQRQQLHRVSLTPYSLPCSLHRPRRTRVGSAFQSVRIKALNTVRREQTGLCHIRMLLSTSYCFSTHDLNIYIYIFSYHNCILRLKFLHRCPRRDGRVSKSVTTAL